MAASAKDQFTSIGEPNERMLCSMLINKVKVKSSMARSLPVENLLLQNVVSIINYLQ